MPTKLPMATYLATWYHVECGHCGKVQWIRECQEDFDVLRCCACNKPSHLSEPDEDWLDVVGGDDGLEEISGVPTPT